jgi:hypothetical protein
VKIFILLGALIAGDTFAQYGGGVQTLQQAGWFDSHHKAYQYGQQRDVYRAQEEEMRLHRELATEQIRAGGNFQRVNLEPQRTCFQTPYGVRCQ